MPRLAALFDEPAEGAHRVGRGEAAPGFEASFRSRSHLQSTFFLFGARVGKPFATALHALPGRKGGWGHRRARSTSRRRPGAKQKALPAAKQEGPSLCARKRQPF